MIRRLAGAAATLTMVFGAACDRNDAIVGERPPARPPRVEPRGSDQRGSDVLREVSSGDVGPMLRAQRAPVLLVNVWSTWCEPCKDEIPEILRTAEEYQARGLGLVLISVDASSERDAAVDFLHRNKAPLPSYVKTGPDDAFIEALHPSWSGALPATLLFDRQRRVRRFWQERVDRGTLNGPIESLLEEANPR